MALDITQIRRDFPILERQVYGNRLSASTTPRLRRSHAG
jgi:hypothetical protein